MKTIQERIDEYLCSPEKDTCDQAKGMLLDYSMQWNVAEYQVQIIGSTVPRWAPWLRGPIGYRTALSPDRFHMIRQLAEPFSRHYHRAIACEFGVYTGGVTKFFIDQGFETHAFDTFEGLKGALPVDLHSNGDYNGGDVSEYIKDARIVKGDVKDTLFLAPERIHIAHIDLDLYEPTKQVLQYIMPRMYPGGIIIVDDYGMVTTPGVKQAVDVVKEEKDFMMLYIPTGQAIIMC